MKEGGEILKEGWAFHFGGDSERAFSFQEGGKKVKNRNVLRTLIKSDTK